MTDRAPTPDSTPVEADDSVRPYFDALQRYSDAWYTLALDHGMKASVAASHAKHVQDAINGLRGVFAAEIARKDAEIVAGRAIHTQNVSDLDRCRAESAAKDAEIARLEEDLDHENHVTADAQKTISRLQSQLATATAEKDQALAIWASTSISWASARLLSNASQHGWWTCAARLLFAKHHATVGRIELGWNTDPLDASASSADNQGVAHGPHMAIRLQHTRHPRA